MDANRCSKGDPPDRPHKKSLQKLKFQPKVPAQKLKKPVVSTSEKPKQEELKPIDQELLRILRTPQVTTKPSPSTNDDCSKQNSPLILSPATGVNSSSRSSGHKQGQPAFQIPKVFPATANPGMFYNNDDDDDDDDDDNDDDENDRLQDLPSSTECEASIHPARELNLHEEDGENRMFLFQFPKSLPMLRKSAIAERKGKAASKEMKEGCSLQELPPGHLGKMMVYKSGKIKMKLGDIMFDVNPGVEYRMPHYAVAINTKEKHCCDLGELQKRHVVVTPNVDLLLNGD